MMVMKSNSHSHSSVSVFVIFIHDQKHAALLEVSDVSDDVRRAAVMAWLPQNAMWVLKILHVRLVVRKL